MKFKVTCRNNADAVRMRHVPGARSVKHNGGKTVIILSDAPADTIAWLEAAHEVHSFVEVTE